MLGPTETVTILTPGEPTEDEYGQTIPSPPTEVDVEALVAPGDSEETLLRQSTVTADFTIYAPAGTAVGTGAQVRVRGDTYEVDGKAADWQVGVVIRVTRSGHT